MRQCPKCPLVSPDNAVRCDCGFEFLNFDLALERGRLKMRGRKFAGAGLVVIVFGLAGGMSLLPIHLSFFLSLGSFKLDIGSLIAGSVLVAKGLKLMDRADGQ